MLDDRERKLLFEIERRLLFEDPELVRSFGVVPDHRPPVHQRGTDMITAVAGLTLCVVLWIGPRPVTDPEVAPCASVAPKRAPAESPAGARRYVR